MKFSQFLTELQVAKLPGLGIARHKMPQIAGDKIQAFLAKLRQDGISSRTTTIEAIKLKPTQDEYNVEKVKALKQQILNLNLKPKPLICSSDNYILDGHHTWLARKEINPHYPVHVIQVNLPIKALIDVASEFEHARSKGIHESFLNFLELQESLVQFNNGAKHGQAVFLAGGSASGKGYSIKNMLDVSSYKIFDVDELKNQLIKFGITKKFPELDGIDTKDDLKDPEKVSKLHNFISDKGWDKKVIHQTLNVAGRSVLPNVLFDVTLKNENKLKEILPQLMKAGYEPRNIHIVWILKKFEIAVQDNSRRARTVPPEIVLQSHQGAAITFLKLLHGGLPKEINGMMAVILNNPEETIFFKGADNQEIIRHGDDGKKIKFVDKFTYVIMKYPGKSVLSGEHIQDTLASWIEHNVPPGTIK